MAQGAQLMLAFGLVLSGALVLVSGVRNRALGEVIKGVTSNNPETGGAVGAEGGGGLNTGAAPHAGAAASSAQVEQWTREGLKAAGVPATPANVATIHGRIIQESGGNPYAENKWDSNALAGHPSRGILQTIPETFAAHHVKGTSKDIFNPVANIAAAVRYMLSRYGHLVGAGPGGY